MDYFFGVKSKALNVLEGKCETALVASAVVVTGVIFLEFGTCFVDRVICQVHVEVVEIALLWGLVLASGKPTKAFVVKIDPQRIYAAKHHVYSKIKFKFVDQKGFVHVSLHNIVPILFKVIQGPGEEYALALAGSFRLAYESLSSDLFAFVRGLFELFLKIAEIGRQQPGLREKFVFFWIAFVHPAQVPGKVIFPGQGVHAGKMVNPLKRLHPVQLVYSDDAIGPEQVPLVLLVVAVSVTLAVAGKAHVE